ncbi:MAG TPA: hypothetical protein VFQ35_04610, partial [Polyangiaceae bacterium]|nr:hypothetical protein [Polyangiaceae bacterium]
MSPRLERLLPWALALVCLIFDPSALADAPKRTLALLLSLGLLVRALGRGEALRLPRATSCLLVIVGLVGVSALYGSGARWLLLGNWWLIAALAVVLGELELEVARGVMARTALLVSLGTSAWLLASWLCGARGMLLHAGQGNPNWAGLVLAIAWPLSLRDASFARARSVLVLGYGVACATALALSESRVAWLAVGVAWVGLTFRSTSRRHAFAQLALLVGAISLTALRSPIGASSARPATNVSAAHPASHAATRAAPELDHSARTSLSGRIWIQRVALRQAIARL